MKNLTYKFRYPLIFKKLQNIKRHLQRHLLISTKKSFII